MRITIAYCGEWNYQARAARLAEKIKVATGNNPDLYKSSGGAFEISVDNKLMYSKKATGRFPEDEDIIALLKSEADSPVQQ